MSQKARAVNSPSGDAFARPRALFALVSVLFAEITLIHPIAIGYHITLARRRRWMTEGPFPGARKDPPNGAEPPVNSPLSCSTGLKAAKGAPTPPS